MTEVGQEATRGGKVKEIFRAGGGGLTRWQNFRVYEHPLADLCYMTSSQTGGSCSSFQEPSYVEIAAERPMSAVEVRQALLNHFRDSECELSPAKKVGLMEKLAGRLRETVDR